MTRQTALERFELSAPEQHKSFTSFAKACIPSVRKAWEEAKEEGRFTRFHSAKQYFGWSSLMLSAPFFDSNRETL